ncbi:armadillo-type protein [Lipomyces orientalis]|uniref:Armadillo-type protein n=1 Tax=Lipomyces orientalis TaxID=1233043 RepID=A0ACC3TM05_9ASCO
MDIAAVLESALLSPDPKTRQNAEAQLELAAKEHFVPYLGMLTTVLGNDSVKTEVRILAGIAIKNQLVAKDVKTKLAQTERWEAIESPSKAQIKQTALQTLLSPDDRVANAAAQLVAAIADIELPRNQWPDLMVVLVDNTKENQPINVKRSSLLAIGYICETADPTNSGVVAQANGILTAIVQGARSAEPSIVVRQTAINALVNSLEFIRDNFEREGERNYIMQVVCEATQAPDEKLQASAFGALARIMSMYYSYMRLYMEKALYGLTVEGMKNPSNDVSCMAVEFWSTVSEEEIEITLQQSDVYDEEEVVDRENFEFAKFAINEVLPTLLDLLTRQEEDADDDEWNVSMAAAACLQLFAENTGSAVVNLTLQFVEVNIQQADWRRREAAVMAFGSILDGPDHGTLAHVIGQALPPMLSLMNDPVLQVKDTVAWCLGRIADLVIEGINTETHLPEIMKALIIGFQDHPKVLTNCCWTLINLTEQLGQEGPYSQTTPLSPYYDALLQGLIQASTRTDNENSSRTSTYEALGVLASCSAADTLPLITNVSAVIVQRLESTLTMQAQLVGMDDRSNLEELQISLLSVLTNIIRRVSPNDRNTSDRLMTLLLSLLQQRLPNSLIEEDIFIAIGSVAGAVQENFNVYLEAFIPYLMKALEDPDSPTCNTAVGLVADLAVALGPQIEPYCDMFMNIFLSNLQNTSVRRDVKVSILSSFGDIASAIGPNFEKYLAIVMQVLVQASSLRKEADSPYDIVDYIHQLREAILDAYAGIVQGMREKPDVLLPYIQSIFGFLSVVHTNQSMIRSESVVRSIVGLIGDIADIYKQGEVKNFYRDEWLTDLIRKARADRSFSASLKETAKWAREQQKMQLAL